MAVQLRRCVSAGWRGLAYIEFIDEKVRKLLKRGADRKSAQQSGEVQLGVAIIRHVMLPKRANGSSNRTNAAGRLAQRMLRKIEYLLR
jgi:hypothetical protein